MFSSDRKRRAEKQMAEWLAHPAEFGVSPTSVRHKATYRLNLVSQGDVEIDLVEYVMPDGSFGRGFVNGSLTWSFLGDFARVSDEQVLVAYCGWAWLLPALHAGSIETSFESPTEEARYRVQKESQGLSALTITGKYRIGICEVFEYTGVLRGRIVKGAGNAEAEVSFLDDDPSFGLPAIYFLLGRTAIQSVRKCRSFWR